MDLNEYQDQAVSTAIYDSNFNVIYPALLLAEEAGETAGKVSKMLRDNNGILTSEIREKIILELGDCLWAIAALGRDLKIRLEDIAQANLNKLQDRIKRNVISGSGDHR